MHIKFLVIASLLLPISSFAQTETKPINTKVTFGRYGADCSSGRGVCSFAALGEDSRVETAIHSWKVGVNTIVVEFQIDKLSDAEQIGITGKLFAALKASEPTFFIQQERLILSKESLTNLDLDPLYGMIESGNYEMQIGKERAVVTFKLKTSE